MSIKQPAVVDPADAMLKRPETTYGYDAQGNRISITDANGQVTAFHFDAYNRPTGRTLPAVAGQPAATEATAYDQYGAVDYAIDFLGTVVDTVYDYDLDAQGGGLGRVVRMTWTRAGQAEPEEIQEHMYDSFGRADLVTETKSGLTRVTDYDYCGCGSVSKVTSPEGWVAYAYDPATDRRTKMYTENTEVQYGYDPLGRLSAVAETVRAGVPQETPTVTAYAYDAVGNVETVETKQGGSTVRLTTNSYHPVRHWLDGVENKAAGVVVSDFTYTRRADGQVEQVTESVAQPGGGSVTTVTAYTYDALNRLATEAVTTDDAVSGDYAISHELDMVGNRLQKVRTGAGAVTTVATYNERDQLTQEVVTGGSNPGTVTYGYDANGSQTHRSGPQPRTQSWDARGRLIGATDGGGATAYGYASTGVRTSATEGGVTTRYLIDVHSPSGFAQVVEERAGGGLYAASYVYGAGLDPISMNRDYDAGQAGVEPALYLADGHSGVRQAATPGGAVLLVQRFDGFGNTVAQSNPSSLVNPIGYRGERFDATLGQYYLRARYYDPGQGRFTAVDPFGGTYGDPLQAMRYGYAGANPVWALDPSGLLAASFGAASIGSASFRGQNNAAVIGTGARLTFQLRFLAEYARIRLLQATILNSGVATSVAARVLAAVELALRPMPHANQPAIRTGNRSSRCSEFVNYEDVDSLGRSTGVFAVVGPGGASAVRQGFAQGERILKA